MLRAMREALQAHAAAHPGEPFDHERHMPDCMRKAREDPETWASTAQASMTAEAENTVIAKLKETFAYEKNEIETMHEIITEGLLSDEILLLCALGSNRMVEMSKTKGAGHRHFETLTMNLKACMSKAFPVCDVVYHQKQDRRMGKKFRGFGFCGIKRQTPPPGDGDEPFLSL